jgi:hypothetical protein
LATSPSLRRAHRAAELIPIAVVVVPIHQQLIATVLKPDSVNTLTMTSDYPVCADA